MQDSAKHELPKSVLKHRLRQHPYADSPALAPEVPFEATTPLPKGSSNTVISLFYLEAPLSLLGQVVDRNIATEGDNLLIPSAFHTGVGFVFRNCPSTSQQNIEFAIDYVATNFMDVFLPEIDEAVQPPNAGSLKWNNGAYLSYYSYIDRNYWTKSTYIGTITADLLPLLQSWCFETFMPVHQTYVFPRVITDLTNPRFADPLLRNSICDTFAMEFFMQAERLGARIEYVTPPNIIAPAFVVPEKHVRQLDINNPVDIKIIIDYYSQIRQLLAHKLAELQPKVGALLDCGPDTQQKCSPNQGDVTARNQAMKKAVGTDYLNILRLIMSFKIPHVVLYSYAANTAQMSYFLLTDPKLYVNYIISDLQRNVPIRNIQGQTVLSPLLNVGARLGLDPVDENKPSWQAIKIFALIALAIAILWFVSRKTKQQP